MLLNHTAALTKRNIVGKHKVKNISQNLCCCVMHLLLLYWTILRLSLNFTLIVSTCQNASLYQQIKLLWGTWFISARKLSRFWTKCWVVNRHKKLFGIPKFFRWWWRRYNLFFFLFFFIFFLYFIFILGTTAAIVEHFKEKLPPSKTPLFKALLNEICTFQKPFNLPHNSNSSQKGVWRLKDEFRWALIM